MYGIRYYIVRKVNVAIWVQNYNGQMQTSCTCPKNFVFTGNFASSVIYVR